MYIYCTGEHVMRMDEDYSYISVCPVKLEQLSKEEIYYSGGVCPICGHDDNSTITHERKVVGKWARKDTLKEYIQRAKPIFYPKEKAQ